MTKKREKKGITPFFHHTRNNSLPLPIPLYKTPLFFKFPKTPHLKINPLRDGNFFKYFNPCALLIQPLFKKLTPELIHSAYLWISGPYTRSKGVPTMSL
jgi:hypothetical protein